MHFARSARVVSGGVNGRGGRGSSKLQESFGVVLPPPALLSHDQECAGRWSEWEGIGPDQKKNGIFMLEGIYNDHFNSVDTLGCCASRARLSLAVSFPGEGMDTKPSARIG